MAKAAGEAAREARLAIGISQRLAAEAAGMNQVALYRIEQSKAEFLPRDVVDRLADVYAQFGISRDYLRRFAPPGSYPEAANASLPELRPALLSPFERAAIRRKMKRWSAERDFQARSDFRARVEPLKRVIVERFLQGHADIVSYEDYYFQADCAVHMVAETLLSNIDIEEQLESAIEARLAEYHSSSSALVRATSMQQWQRRVISRIYADSIRPQQLDTVPVFKCLFTEERRLVIDFDQIVERLRRPGSLAQRRSVYGIRLPNSLLRPFYAADDVMLIEAISPLPLEDELGLVFALGKETTEQVFATFGAVRGVRIDMLNVRYWHSGDENELHTWSAIFHRTIRVQDLLS